MKIASLLFLFFLALHVAHCLVVNRRVDAKTDPHSIHSPLTVLTQVPLYALACWIGYRYGLFTRDLVSPGYIVLGLALGHIVFCGSSFVLHRSLHAVWELFIDLRDIGRFMIESPFVLSRFVTVAFSEELIYRGVAQTLLIDTFGSPLLGITIAAVVFSVVHQHFFKNSPVVSIEFFGFALLMGGIYWWSGSLILVMAIHGIRDVEIAYLEFIERFNEYNDWERAIDEIERGHMPGRVEHA